MYHDVPSNLAQIFPRNSPKVSPSPTVHRVMLRQSTLDTLGQSQKILLADKIFPEEREVKSWKGPRWDKNVIEKRILVA